MAPKALVSFWSFSTAKENVLVFLISEYPMSCACLLYLSSVPDPFTEKAQRWSGPKVTEPLRGWDNTSLKLFFFFWTLNILCQSSRKYLQFSGDGRLFWASVPLLLLFIPSAYNGSFQIFSQCFNMHLIRGSPGMTLARVFCSFLVLLLNSMSLSVMWVSYVGCLKLFLLLVHRWELGI